MAPGAMQLARTPPPSSAIALVSATTPALEAAYAAEPRTPLSVAALSAATFPLRPRRSTTAAPRFPEPPVTTTRRRSSVDMAGQSTQNGAADARPRSPVRRRALRRAAGAHARLRGELPLRQARADGDSGAAART